MFVAFDRFFRRVRSTAHDDRGASLVIVVALMAMGFVVAIVIAGAALFSIQQNSAVKSNVQAFAAAEAGRDAVVSALEIAPSSCPGTAQYTDDPSDATDPTFSVAVFSTDAVTQPTGSTGLAQRCPLNTDKWVVLRSTGTGANGTTTTVDAVYPWERFRLEVAGGGLGYMDSSLTSSWSNTSGDTVIKRGDFTCGGSTVFDGNVFVLGGGVFIRQGTFEWTTCQIKGDLYASGDINVQRGCFLVVFCGAATLRVDGQVKTLASITAQGVLEAGVDPAAPYRNIEARGSIITNHSNARIEAFNGGSVRAEQGISASAGPIRASADIVANQSISAASAEVRAYGGGVLAGVDVNGGSTVRAQTTIRAGRNIDGSGTRQVDGGGVMAVGAIGGSVNVVAALGVVAGGDIATTGSVAANGGDLHAGGTISGGARSASGSVIGVTGVSAGNVSAGGSIRTNGAISGTGSRVAAGAVSAGSSISGTGEVRASTGGILAGTDITGAGARIAGSSATAPVGNIQARGRIESTGGTTAVNLLASGAIKVDGTCRINGNVHAGGALTFDDVVANQRAGWNTPACTIGGGFWSPSATKSTLGTYTAPTGGRANGTFPNTRIPAATSIRVPAGWNPATSNYFLATNGTPTPAGTGTTPGAPTIEVVPVVTAPAVSVPAPFAMQLNEDPDGTWETFDDLQLRTTWVDLGTYTTWPGYTPVGPISGGNCGSTWFGTGGQVRTILQNAGAVTVGGHAIPANVPVVIDATQCTTVNLGTWSSTVLRRDAVLLVNNASFTFAAFTANEKHQLAIVQVDKDDSAQVPGWNPGGEPEPVPNCSTGQSRISMTFTGTGNLDEDVNLLLYSPCGINGNFASNWRGHLYTHNDNVQSGILTTLVCEPMRVTGVVDLPCDINDIAEFGNMNVNAWRLGDRASQTER